MRTNVSSSQIDMLGTKSATNESKFKYIVMTYCGRGTNKQANMTAYDGGTILPTCGGIGIAVDMTV